MFYQSSKYCCLAIAVLSVIPTTEVNADQFKVSGFIGVGGAYSSANNFLGKDKKSHEIVDAGLQIYNEFSNNLSATGQITYRRLGELTTDDAPRIDFASLDYYTQFLGETQVSIGRVKPTISLYNTTRDLPMSRPTIIMPQAVYSDFFRNILLSFDGIRISNSHNTPFGLFSGELAYGKANIDENFDPSVLGETSNGTWKSNNAQAIDLRLNGDDYTLSFTVHSVRPKYTAASDSRLQTSIPGFAIPLLDGVLDITSYHLGFQYRSNNTEYSAELVKRDNKLIGIVPRSQTVSEGFYTQVRYSFSPSFTGTLRYELYYRNKEFRSGSTEPPFIYPPYANTSKSVMTGLVWQITPNVQLAADLHLVRGGGTLTPFAAISENAFKKKYWTLAATQLTYRF